MWFCLCTSAVTSGGLTPRGSWMATPATGEKSLSIAATKVIAEFFDDLRAGRVAVNIALASGFDRVSYSRRVGILTPAASEASGNPKFISYSRSPVGYRAAKYSSIRVRM